GVSAFTVSADGNVHQGTNELGVSGLPRTFALDDVSSPDVTPPTTSITAPSAGATVSRVTPLAPRPPGDRAVTKVEFYLAGALQSTDPTSPYSWSWDTTTAANGAHTLTTKAYDAAGNVGTSAPVDVTVNNAGDTTPPTAPGNLTASPAKR